MVLGEGVLVPHTGRNSMCNGFPIAALEKEDAHDLVTASAG